MAVDPARPNPAREVGEQSATRPNKVVAHAEIESEVMVLDSAKNRLGDAADVKLIVTPQPAIAPYDAPSNTRCQKLRADLIISRRIDSPEQVSRLDRKFEAPRIKFSRRKFRT